VASVERLHRLTFLLALLVVAGCAGRQAADRATSTSATLPPDPAPRSEPRSRYGNGPYYEVYGVTYEVLNTSYGFKERGVASWYGKKFHGRPTSSQEPYDMYAMTAAHKTLPLPTYVRVRNLRKDKNIVVRVNDRGPFVDNRIIDLSYAAAVKLDMIEDGTSLVEITALQPDDPAHSEAGIMAAGRSPSAAGDTDIFVQVGAFGDRANAKRRYDLLRARGIKKIVVHKDIDVSPSLYRIRIGPVADVQQYDSIVQRLQTIGISDTHLVTD
jgi:rare lipoprotein A